MQGGHHLSVWQASSAWSVEGQIGPSQRRTVRVHRGRSGAVWSPRSDLPIGRGRRFALKLFISDAGADMESARSALAVSGLVGARFCTESAGAIRIAREGVRCTMSMAVRGGFLVRRFFFQPARALSTDVSSIRGSEDDSADTMAAIMLGVEPHHPYRICSSRCSYFLTRLITSGLFDVRSGTHSSCSLHIACGYLALTSGEFACRSVRIAYCLHAKPSIIRGLVGTSQDGHRPIHCFSATATGPER